MSIREEINREYKDFLVSMDEIYVGRATRSFSRTNLKSMLVLDEWLLI